jgi:hypothetical protein
LDLKGDITMAKSDWIIGGAGGQSVITIDGSHRLQLSGFKHMLWNGRDDLANSEVIALIKPYANENSGRQKGGGLLRCDASILNYYQVICAAYTSYRLYRIYRIVNGVSTLLSQVTSYQGYNIYVKTRFRIDGWQISIDEYSGGEWHLITTIEDTDHSIVSGYAGLIATNYNGNYSFIYDDVQIGENV